MDNRKAMIAAFEIEYRPAECHVALFDGRYFFVRPDGSSRGVRNDEFNNDLIVWGKAWQAATAHNTDAVIDEVILRLDQFIKIHTVENDIDRSRLLLSQVCKLRPRIEALRSLKTNKEG